MKHPLILIAIGAALIWDYGKNCATCRASATGGSNNQDAQPLSVSNAPFVNRVFTRAPDVGSPQPTFTSSGSPSQPSGVTQSGNSVFSNVPPGTYSPGSIPVPGHPVFLRQSQSTIRTAQNAGLSIGTGSRLNIRRII